MSFTAWYYPFFLAAVVVLWWRLARAPRLVLVLAASCVFYGAWDTRFLALLAASAVMDFLCGLAIGGERRPTRFVLSACALPVLWLVAVRLVSGAQAVPDAYLAVAGALAAAFALAWTGLWRLPAARRADAFMRLQIVCDLALLGFFKYFGFFVESAHDLLALAGITASLPVLQVVLPVGISFYTFQSIAYAVDVRRGRTEPCRDALLFGAFIGFFPQLVAGPIERAGALLPQLDRRPAFDPAFIHEGCRLLLVGWFKKLFVADNCALVANAFFEGSGRASAAWVILGTVAFAFQIYGDFSGYTDIARGSARLLGVRLTDNFRQPYLACSPSDFWRRWHISLSSWIRDYLYVPLGGDRHGTVRTLRNLYVSMLLAGLWHGAAWHYVAWGAYHATLQAAYRGIAPLRALASAGDALRLAAIALMFVWTLLGWLIFRAPDMHFVGLALGSLIDPLTLPGPDWRGPALWVALHVGPLLVLQAVTRRAADEARLETRPLPLRALDYAVMLLLVLTAAAPEQDFIYFQF